MVEELTFEGFEEAPKTDHSSETQDQAFSIMQEQTAVPRDRRRMNRRQDHRRSRPGRPPNESRTSYRRGLFDRRGMQWVCKTSAPCSKVTTYLEQFDRHWSLAGLDPLQVRASVIDEFRWCLEWRLNVDHVPLSWRSLAVRLRDSPTFTLQPLGGDLDVFDGRIWATSLEHGSQVHFNLTAAFGLGSFERLVGNIFRHRCEKIFRALVLKWKNDLDHLP